MDDKQACFLPEAIPGWRIQGERRSESELRREIREIDLTPVALPETARDQAPLAAVVALMRAGGRNNDDQILRQVD